MNDHEVMLLVLGGAFGSYLTLLSMMIGEFTADRRRDRSELATSGAASGGAAIGRTPRATPDRSLYEETP